MGQKHQVSFRQYIEDDFACQHCKTIGRARYLAKGTGAWAREGIFGDASSAQAQSAESAAQDLSRDAEIVKSYLKCPVCHQRSPHAFMMTRIGVALSAAFAIVMLAFTGGGFGKELGLAAATVAVYFAGRAWFRVRRADEATFSMVEKGEVPAAKPKRAPLPQARLATGTAPKIATPPVVAPVVPVRTSAPELVESRGNDDGPAFLK